MPEDKEFKTIKAAELTIEKVTLQGDRRLAGSYNKVILHTKEKGDVTFKCSKQVKETRETKGFEVVNTKSEPLLLEEIPDIFVRINNIVRVRSVCRVRLDYTASQMEYDGDLKTFRFISKSQLSELRILDQGEREEVVEDEFVQTK